MKVLAITNLFPSDAEPRRGLFNFEQLRALAQGDEVQVLAPVPRYPLMRLLGARSAAARAGAAPAQTVMAGMGVTYPRYPYVPRIGQCVHDRLFAYGIAPAVRASLRAFDPDVVFATWAYPDVVAAARLAARHQRPFVAKVHGTDVNDYFASPTRRRAIVAALRSAGAVVTVSRALAERLAAAGVDADRVHVIYNGVDTTRFAPRDRHAARAALGLEDESPLALFVGNLKPVKGIDTLLRAFARVFARDERARLSIVGYGPLLSELRALATTLAVAHAVRFEGERDPDTIARWMNAADVLCLPSRMEGVPNVVREATASGLAVVATRVGGIPEVVEEGRTGWLVPAGDTDALAAAIAHALDRPLNSEAIRASAASASWAESAGHLRTVLQLVAARSAG